MPDAPQTRGQRIAAAMRAGRGALVLASLGKEWEHTAILDFPNPDAIGEVVDALQTISVASCQGDIISQVGGRVSLTKDCWKSKLPQDDWCDPCLAIAALARLDEVKT